MGCGPRTVVQHQTRVVVPDAGMLRQSLVNPPPNREDFMNASPTLQIQMLGRAWQKQTASLVKCNIQLEGISNWKSEVLEKYKKLDSDNDKVNVL